MTNYYDINKVNCRTESLSQLEHTLHSDPLRILLFLCIELQNVEDKKIFYI